MALLILALIFSICCRGCASSLIYHTSAVESDPAVQRSGNVCKDCTQIIELLTDMLSNPDLQKKIIGGIEILCDHLPGPATTAQACKDEVEKMLPMAISFLTGFVQPAQICKMIGLCGASGKQEEMLKYLVEAVQAAGENDNAQPSAQCSFCILLVKTLERLLPKERTEDAVTKVFEEICKILPPTYRDQCDNLIDKYSKMLMDAILGYATPQALCALIHMCKGTDAPVADPCTLPAYRCSNVQTAFKCGTFFYCQKFSWKPLNTI
ncbi:surfactant protein Ba [Salarias fasciatus]|uniref:surfactant protein Ba n=1 Tax=Salarias fasciatus TaxID=181472 RepID=UPI001176D1B5|nr:prosaposin-like [Salarias fasciatus]XP_029941561.1 prosaposin-like [Salarias fasciatus]